MLKKIYFDLDVSIKNINIGAVKEKNVSTVQLVMNITDGGKPFDISGAAYAQISIRRPDKTISNSLAVVDGNKVSYILEPNAVYQLGVHEAELQLFAGDNKLLISSTFYYSVIDSIYDESGITEQEKYPILVELITKVENQLKLIEEYLNHKFMAIKRLEFYNNGYVAEYVDGSVKEWDYSVDDKGQIIALNNTTDNKTVTISWHNTER